MSADQILDVAKETPEVILISMKACGTSLWSIFLVLMPHGSNAIFPLG